MKENICVLVVEDAVIAQRVAELTLTELSCHVDIASTGEEAIAMFREGKYDLIFMDIGLPGISGIDATKKIRKIESANSHVPIVALTANDDESYEKDCLESGLNDFMLKPLNKEKGEYVMRKFLIG